MLTFTYWYKTLSSIPELNWLISICASGLLLLNLLLFGINQFNKTIRNGSSPQCVVEEIAEQCRQIRIRQKINRVAADIRVKGNLPRFALICITAQNSIEQRNITALQ